MLSKVLVAASTKPLILTILLDGETYGYRIIKQMKALSWGRLEWSFGMLYPVLHRLEKDGYIASSWKSSDKERLRKYYRLTEAGRRELEREKSQWSAITGLFTSLWESEEARS